MKIDKPTHVAEPAWIDAAWRLLVWLNCLALAVCVVAVPAWGFVTGHSYGVVPTGFDVVAITLASLLPFGFFLALAKEGGTPGDLGWALFTNCIWLLVTAGPISKLGTTNALDFGDWILASLAPITLLNFSFLSIVYFVHRAQR